MDMMESDLGTTVGHLCLLDVISFCWDLHVRTLSKHWGWFEEEC